jgi:ABC-2 type transport system permease protein
MPGPPRGMSGPARPSRLAPRAPQSRDRTSAQEAIAVKHVLAIAAKELRSFFNSAVALIFLATFLFVVLFTFFWVEKFFARNIADVRPMFEWMPVLLIFLVSALTMRMWSEEQKLGTLEVLLTLPVPVHHLVLGKFLAGLTLVALALALTLGVPVTVSMMGDLDWGPVVGGYLGALLLACAYLAVGLCVSSLTQNQIVALIFTALSCGLLYVPGTEGVAGVFGNRGSEILRALGTGSRFTSIARGVLDIRDVAYYAGLTTLFLVLNHALLLAKRWSAGRRTWLSRWNTKLLVGLVLGNVLLANLWLAPLAAARIDLTERGEYSLSDVTEELVESLDEPLLVRGYFSERTHPLLAPLVPQIRDLLSEYAVIGGSNVRVEFLDPRGNEEIEKEAQEQYNIKSVPMQFADRHEAAVVNSYFHILVKYGDQHEVLDFGDLIEVKVTGMDSIEVKLRNLEYDVTRAIKKVAYGFQSLDALFASLGGKAELTAYITPSSLPQELKEVPQRLEKVAKEIEKQSNGKFVFQAVVPDTQEKQQELQRKYGIKPFAASLFSSDRFYLHILLKVGDRLAQVSPGEQMTEAELRSGIEAALRRAAPGFLKTVGLVTPPAESMPQMNPMMPQQPPRPPQSFELLERRLGENYTVQPVSLDTGKVDDGVDVLLLAGPEKLGDKAQRAVDQFLMRGGSVVLLAGKYRLDIGMGGGLAVKQVSSGLDKLLETWGARVQNKLVLDQRSDSFPVPVMRSLGGLRVQEIQLIPYPFFVRVERDRMSEGSIITQGLPAITLHWSSPLEAVETGKKDAAGKDGKAAGKSAAEEASEVKREVLLSSGEESWLQEDSNVQPDFERYPERGFSRPAAGEGVYDARPLAMVLTGTFASHFRGEADKKAEPPADKGSADKPERPERLLTRSVPNARLAVVGSSSFVSDEVLNLAQQTQSGEARSNLQFVENLVDWAVADVDLLEIRSSGSFARTLSVAEDARSKWEYINYGLAILALGLVMGWNAYRRRTLAPMTLDPRARRKQAADSAKEAS